MGPNEVGEIPPSLKERGSPVIPPSTHFSFSSPPLPFLAVYYYAMALGDVVGPVEGEAEGLSNFSDIILYISNS